MQQVGLGRLHIRGREHRGLEVGDVARLVRHVVAVGVADGLAAGPLIDDVADGVADLEHRILTLEDEQEDARALHHAAGDEMGEDVFPDEFLRRAMPGLGVGDDAGRILLHQLRARGEHACRDDLQAGAGDEPGHDSPRPRFADGVRGDEHIGKFFGHR